MFKKNNVLHQFTLQFLSHVRNSLIYSLVLGIAYFGMPNPITFGSDEVAVETTRTDTNTISAFLFAYTSAGSSSCNVQAPQIETDTLSTTFTGLAVSTASDKLGAYGRVNAVSSTNTIPAPMITTAQASVDITSGNILSCGGFIGAPNTTGLAEVDSEQFHTAINRVGELVGGGTSDGIHTMHVHLHLIQFGGNTDHISARENFTKNGQLFFYPGNTVSAQVGDSFASAEYVGNGYFYFDVSLQRVDNEAQGGEGLPLTYDELVPGRVNDHFFAQELVTSGQDIAITCLEDTTTSVSNSGHITTSGGLIDSGRSRDIWQYKAFGSFRVTDDCPPPPTP